MKYGRRLKELRKQKGLSQKELTEKLNINRSTYARYETSTTQPDYDTLEKIADFYEVTIDYILGRSESAAVEEDEEFEEFIREAEIWYKSEPETQEERLKIMRRMLEVFKDED